MGALSGLTIDLWGTILYSRDPQEKIERRRAMLLEAIREAGRPCEVDELRAAFRESRQESERQVELDGVDIGPAGKWALLTQSLGLPDGLLPFERVAAAYHDLTLEYLPPLMPGVRETLVRLRDRYRIGLICNTGFTGGNVLRDVLDAHQLTGLFDSLTFSNEFGYLKPDPRIFHHTLDGLGVMPGQALHLGDVEHQDVAGARAIGMYTARYVPEGEAETDADLFVRDWHEFPELLETLPPSVPPQAGGGGTATVPPRTAS